MADRVLVGSRKGLLELRRGPHGWRHTSTAHLGLPVTYALRDPSTGAIWAALDHGHWGTKLQRSDDDGASWREVAAPKYPAGSEVKEGKPASTDYLWVMEADPHRPGRLYIGTEPGGLFYADEGQDFTLVEPLWDHPTRTQWFGGGRDGAGIHSVVFDPRSDQRILIGVSCGGMYETTDGGATWAPRNKGLYADFLPNPSAEVGQDPHLIVMAPSNPDVLWQQNHCGVFRSVDGGAQWQDVGQEEGPVKFGFAVAVADDDADTAWVVPGINDECRTTIGQALQVCRTTDGGATWTSQTQGLPQESCFDLIFRHALAISGDTLVMGSTTGNLWISEDRGDSWNHVAGHLPPIYSVRLF